MFTFFSVLIQLFVYISTFRHDPDASLESVDLDDPDPDGNTLEAFLNEPDVLYDVSPLPKDDTTPILQKLENTSNIPTPTVSNVDEISPPNPASYASGVVSREESMYFTPDATTEKLSEISLEWIPNLQNTFIVLIVISNHSMKIQSVIIQITQPLLTSR